MSELNEFYPYEDMPGIAQGPEKFAAEFKGGEWGNVIDCKQPSSSSRCFYGMLVD